jgi:hypothetical protein
MILICYYKLTNLLIPWCQNPKVHHRIHNSPPTIPLLSQVDPFYTPQTISLRSIFIPSSHLHLDLQSGFLLSVLPTETLYTIFLSPMRATCAAHLILLDLICYYKTLLNFNFCTTSHYTALH